MRRYVFSRARRHHAELRSFHASARTLNDPLWSSATYNTRLRELKTSHGYDVQFPEELYPKMPVQQNKLALRFCREVLDRAEHAAAEQALSTVPLTVNGL
jgi:hypothetical protein